MKTYRRLLIVVAVVLAVGISIVFGAVFYDDKPSNQEVAAARSVVEEYFRACEEKDSQAILKTLTPAHNIPNTFLFGEETKTLLTIDYNPEDPMREWYITSGRGSDNDIRKEVLLQIISTPTKSHKRTQIAA